MISTVTIEKPAISRIDTSQDQVKTFIAGTDRTAENLLRSLSPSHPWGERQITARKLGQLRSPQAVPGLLTALRTDPFWMVRCEIIQALELIKDDRAVPVLEEIALKDGFQVVRSYALKAIKKLSI